MSNSKPVSMRLSQIPGKSVSLAELGIDTTNRELPAGTRLIGEVPIGDADLELRALFQHPDVQRAFAVASDRVRK